MNKAKYIISIVALSIAMLGTANVQAATKPSMKTGNKTLKAGETIEWTLKNIKASNIKSMSVKVTDGKASSKESNKNTIQFNKKKVNGQKSKKVVKVKGIKSGSVTLKITVKLKDSYAKKNKFDKTMTFERTFTVKANSNNNGGKSNKDTSKYKNGAYETIDEAIVRLRKNGEEVTKVGNYALRTIDESNEEWYTFLWGDSSRDFDWMRADKFKQIEAKMKQFVSECHIESGDSDYVKSFRVARHYGRWCKDIENGNNTVETFFLLGQGKCGARSQAYVIMMRYLGIEATYLPSVIQNHADALVKLGKYWYWYDPWQFPTILGYGCTDDIALHYQPATKGMYDNADDYRQTEVWKKEHEMDTIGYYVRCRREGISYLTDEELLALPE